MDYDDYPDWGDNCDFAQPGSGSALRAATATNPRNIKCPTCGHPDRLTPADVERGYQCDACADAMERGWEIDYYEPEASVEISSVRVDSNDGESYTQVTVFKVDVNLSDEELDEWMDDEFASEHCQHEHDCCGRFYGSRGTWALLKDHYENGKLVAVTQTFNLNI